MKAEAKTGKRPQGAPRNVGRHHSAAPVAAEGRLYFPDDHGVTHVLKAGPTFEVISRNDLAEECSSWPAVPRGQIFIWMVNDPLGCIGKPAVEP